jgi:UDP-N-acetylmuramoyl-tripeptide--D-alanyl-D-alanine ligase
LKEADAVPVLSGAEIVEATGGEIVRGKSGVLLSGISTDSRAVAAGNLFIPLVGEKFNGHDFLAVAVRAGAYGVLLQKSEIGRLGALPDSVTAIAVNDTLRALGDIARFRRRMFSAPVLAITGSSGKTTTKEMAAAIIGAQRRLLKTEGNFNNLIGLPLTLLRLNDTHEAVILELGTNRRGEIARLTEIAEPAIGLITNIGSAHLEGFKTIETVKEEKGDLFRGLSESGIAVVNNDSPVLKELAARHCGKCVTYAVDQEADLRAANIEGDGNRMRFDLIVGGAKGRVTLKASGRHSIYNALGAAAASWVMGIAPESIQRGLESFRPVAGRMELVALRNGAFLINDAYNANPDSVEAALKTLAELKAKGAAVAVLGDMLELGARAEEMHERIGESAAAKGLDRIYLRGEFSDAVIRGARRGGIRMEQVFKMQDAAEIAASVREFLKSGDWVLIKGSRRMRMEEVSDCLTKVIGITETAE